jgi:hypothetical protein
VASEKGPIVKRLAEGALPRNPAGAAA